MLILSPVGFWELLQSIFASPAGSFGLMGSISAFVIWCIFKSGSIVEKMKTVDAVKNKQDKRSIML